MSAIWHDVECGAYREDLPVWRALAAEHGDPVLDIGSGTGRIALDLARRGHSVTALDRDPALVSALAARAHGLPVRTVLADARAFQLQRRFPLCIVPMQTIQLLGRRPGRARFLDCAREHLAPGGVLAAAIAAVLEPFEVIEGQPAPAPDIREVGSVVYSSHPVAVRLDREAFVLRRRRETVTAAGERTVKDDEIRLDRLDPDDLEHEASAAGLTPAGRAEIQPTTDYVGSVVVMLRA